MSDLKLFRLTGGQAVQLPSSPVALERSLQHLIEHNMEVLFGVRFLATEYSTGKLHGGRIDSLGIDENNQPVIFEYKRSTSENVINQGLFYLDWLLDHRAEFNHLASVALGTDAGASVDWSSPRLVCVASGFTKYDEHAVRQINRTIDLVRYSDFQGELLALELVTSVAGPTIEGTGVGATKSPTPGKSMDYKTVSEYLEQAPGSLQDLYGAVEAFALSMGDDVQKKVTKFYIAFKRIKNFACVEIRPQAHEVLVYLKVPPSSVALEEGFSRDVSTIGHYGTGDLELRLKTTEDLNRVKTLIEASYENS